MQYVFKKTFKNKTKEKFIRMQTNGYFLLARARKREFVFFFWCRTVMTMHGVLYNSMDYVIILITFQ